MTVDTYERSEQDAAPVDLLLFQIYDLSYRYTSAAESITYDGQEYEPAVFSVPSIEQSTELARNDLQIDTAADFPMLTIFDTAPPSDVLRLTILRMHRGDTDAAQLWAGRVTAAERRQGAGMLTCESIYTSSARASPFRYARLCQHVLYGAACGANGAAFRIEVAVDSVADAEITASELAAHASGRFAGGMLEWTAEPGRVERRGIKAHAGDMVTMTHGVAGLATGDTVRLYPGCAHTLADCNDYFANAVNYGGFPHVPRQNPFGASSVF